MSPSPAAYLLTISDDPSEALKTHASLYIDKKGLVVLSYQDPNYIDQDESGIDKNSYPNAGIHLKGKHAVWQSIFKRVEGEKEKAISIKEYDAK